MTEWWAAGCRETARRFVSPLCVAFLCCRFVSPDARAGAREKEGARR